MMGFLIGLVALLTIAVGIQYQDPTTGRMGAAATTSGTPSEEALAESAAEGIQYAMADLAASCVEPSSTSPAACANATAATGAATTGSMQALATETAYSAGLPTGRVLTYVVRTPTANYLASSWVPANAAVASRYCARVQADLLRLTGDFGWVSPFDGVAQAAYVTQANVTSPGAALVRTTVAMRGVPFTNGCPVMVEEVDQ